MITILRRPTIVASQKKMYLGAGSGILADNAVKATSPNFAIPCIDLPAGGGPGLTFAFRPPDGVKRMKSMSVLIEDIDVTGAPLMNVFLSTYKITPSIFTFSNQDFDLQANWSPTLLNDGNLKMLQVPVGGFDNIGNPPPSILFDLFVGRDWDDESPQLTGAVHMIGVYIEFA